MSDGAARAAGRREAGAVRRFREALRREGERAAAEELARRSPGSSRALPARRPGAGPAGRRDGERGEGARDGAGTAPPGTVRRLGLAPEPRPAELRELLRSLPVAIDASRVREGAPLALSFGGSLDVEIRPTPSGLELLLRPCAPLARAAAAELPGMVAALRARGLRVASAEVRPRGLRGGGRGSAVR